MTQKRRLESTAMIYQAVVGLPILGALIAGFLGRAIGPRPSEIVTSTCLVVAAALSWFVFWKVGLGHESVRTVKLLQWVNSGDLDVSWAIRVDTLTAVMLVVVNTVSALVHIYSIGYMAEDDSRPRFFAYLSLFTFAMLMLVTADNFLQLFFGWEGVGLASYLLIGFWYHKPEANAAAIKAFVVNRVGDFGFALGIFGIFYIFRTISFDQVFADAPAMAGKTMDFLGYQVDIMTCLAENSRHHPVGRAYRAGRLQDHQIARPDVRHKHPGRGFHIRQIRLMIALEWRRNRDDEYIRLAGFQTGFEIARLHRGFNQNIEIGLNDVNPALIDRFHDTQGIIDPVHLVTLGAEQRGGGQAYIAQANNTDGFVKARQDAPPSNYLSYVHTP